MINTVHKNSHTLSFSFIMWSLVKVQYIFFLNIVNFYLNHIYIHHEIHHGECSSLKILAVHCPKSNQNFRDITRNVEENEMLHELFRSVSRFPYYFVFYLGKSITCCLGLPLYMYVQTTFIESLSLNQLVS